MRTVHYMVRKLGTSGEAIYPSELDENDGYYGVGSFFLSGIDEWDRLDKVYSFWAIRDGRPIETMLERRTAARFFVDVGQIGQFGFKARRVGVPVVYAGTSAAINDPLLIRQLAPLDQDGLERAVRDFDFYFVGLTPNLDQIR